MELSVQCSNFEDYHVDQLLTLDVLRRHHGETAAPSTIQARVRKLHTRTLSCTMVVDVLGEEEEESVAFLKLFDRRFSDSLRRENGIGPWTKEKEQAYVELAKRKAISDLLHSLSHIRNFEDDADDVSWDDGRKEAYLAEQLLELHDAEIDAYGVLSEFQGHRIPRLITDVSLDPTPPEIRQDPSDLARLQSEHFKVRGVLLQYIEGCDLWDMPEQCPRSSWQDIIDQALATVRMLHDHEIINMDVRTENFKVSAAADGEYRVFMIDFALCRVRHEEEQLPEWGRLKHRVDEEGEVGTVMQRRLLVRYGFQLKFEDFRRFAEWADAEHDFHFEMIGRELRPGVWLYALPQWKE